ncbi:hypothetical protein BAE44_0015261, partial [Dichanthelium oligosanthes]
LKQSEYRKDVERAFGVLQAKFKIVKGPARFWHIDDLRNIMTCCVILHNMAVEDERGLPQATIQDYENATEPDLLPKNMPTIAQLIENHKKTENREVHWRLQQDLMEHVWDKFRYYKGKHVAISHPPMVHPLHNRYFLKWPVIFLPTPSCRSRLTHTFMRVEAHSEQEHMLTKQKSFSSNYLVGMLLLIHLMYRIHKSQPCNLMFSLCLQVCCGAIFYDS